MTRALLFLAAAALAACGGGSSPSPGSAASATGASSYLDGCTPAACGVGMPAPNFFCADGTVGGPGPCVRSPAGSCSWTYRTCAPAASPYLDGCTPAECGPGMAAPNYTCADGTLGGPGPCVRSSAGTCGWTYRTCQPVVACALRVCAPSTALPAQCADGSLAGPLGVCTLLADGACVEVVRSCPAP